MKKDKKIQDLLDLFNELNNMQVSQFKRIKKEVDLIIKNKYTDKKYIERIFDSLLDLTYWFGEKTKDMYYKLLNYYKTIDKCASNDYEKFYLDIITEQNEDNKELIKHKI